MKDKINRTESINVRVTPEEKEKIFELAENEHLSVASFIRLKCFGRKK